jgi:hypothetical protein
MVGLACSPEGHMHPGVSYDVPEALGRSLIEQHEAFEGDAPPKPVRETADAPVGGESADADATREKRGPKKS